MSTDSSQDLRRTALHDAHARHGAKLVPFAGWEMPVQYADGILAEHLQTRAAGGLFDVSHMGRFWVTGTGARDFLQRLLTQNIERLQPGRAIYGLIAYPDGGTVDDSYLYMLAPETYLLVVNAANLDKDYAYIQQLRAEGWADKVAIEDRTAEVSMLALQGPQSEAVLREKLDHFGVKGELTEPGRNSLCTLDWDGEPLIVSRTGYTGEPICFEIFVPSSRAVSLWDALIDSDGRVKPVGLGARDTLRSEAGLPLYGDELSQQISGLAGGLHQLAIRMVDTPADFVGREQLLEEYLGLKGQRVQRFLIEGRGRPPRADDKVFFHGEEVGVVTSAAIIPYWVRGEDGGRSEQTGMRRVGFALLGREVSIGLSRGADRRYGDLLEIKRLQGERETVVGEAEVVAEFSRPSADRSELLPVFYPARSADADPLTTGRAAAAALASGAWHNHQWRQLRCVNLIPSENTPSDFVRWASELDPCGRYAEHQRSGFDDLYYYQGTDWIQDVEERLCTELRLIFGCNNVEPRLISGQMANETVFESMVRFKSWKQRNQDRSLVRLSRVFNNDLALGGHLSSQPMGALFNYVDVNPQGEAAVTHIPLREDYPYAADPERLAALIDEQRPELIIFGKSMVIEPEPIAAARAVVDGMPPEERPIIMYDMAHVLGLCGPLFQQPFVDGADIVTGSTHKTFFGPQRGVVLSNLDETFGRRRFLQSFIHRSAFPGATSNHHLGTLQGMLAAALEWRAFGADYQAAIHDCARAFARALADCGLDVQGDPARGYTQTHQVLLDVGTGKAREMARRLEDSNVLCNFQGLPGDTSFRSARGLRLGVQEMARFGMRPDDFGQLAQLMADCLLRDTAVGDAVAQLRGRFLDMQYCYDDLELAR